MLTVNFQSNILFHHAHNYHASKTQANIKDTNIMQK